MSALFIGLISGTSSDGIDAALVRSAEGSWSVLSAITVPYKPGLRRAIEAVIREGAAPLATVARLDRDIAGAFADAARELLEAAGFEAAAVSAVGSHGQTVGHFPGVSTMQLGDPNLIAAHLGIPVAADFRRADMMVGGQGAPLAPLFHRAVFASSDECRAIVNLGGIANVTVLGTDSTILGYDTGPANTLLDGWHARHHVEALDLGGAVAASGRVDAELLERLLDEPYFMAPPPKSTGRERFNMDWLDMRLEGLELAVEDVQATLAELTAVSVAMAMQGLGIEKVFTCGGGVRNTQLMTRLAEQLAPLPVSSTIDLGVDPDFVEAAAFAWLAEQRIAAASPEGLASVTGATRAAVLGGLWLPPRGS